MADTEDVIVSGTPVGEPENADPKPTNLVDEGKPSAATKTKPGPSKGEDTLDRTAQDWLQSGAKADASIKGDEAPSAETLREDYEDVDKAMARDNITNMAEGSSNHNTTAGTNPVSVAQVDRPDYNPQRRPSSRANMASTVGEAPTGMADRVEAKKKAPTNAEIVRDRRADANEARETPLDNYQSPFLGEN